MLVDLIGALTTRAGLGFTLALVFGLLIGSTIIQMLRKGGAGQPIRNEGPRDHISKGGTPTMGGLLILALFFVVGAFVLKWLNPYVIIAAITLLLFGSIGFADDAIKVFSGKNKGLSGLQKLVLQIAASLFVLLVMHRVGLAAGSTGEHGIVLYFLGDEWMLPTWLWGLWGVFFMVGFSNAANLTDGLDGLLGGTILPVLLSLGILGYLSGHIVFAEHLELVYRSNAGEVAVVFAILTGAIGAFLWFNTNPATVFMGDVGSLALGAVIAALAIALQFELILLITGAVFVAEAVSVMIQVGYFKLSGGKRLFRMAPIHHHFEFDSKTGAGVPEPKLVVRFWMTAWVCTLVGILLLFF